MTSPITPLFLIALLLILPYTLCSFEFHLIDLKTGKAVRQLQNNFAVCAKDHPKGFSIKAVPSSQAVHKVHFGAQSFQSRLNYHRLEYKSPYTIAGGDVKGNILPWKIGSLNKGKIMISVKGRGINGNIVEETKLVGFLRCVKDAQLAAQYMMARDGKYKPQPSPDIPWDDDDDEQW